MSAASSSSSAGAQATSTGQSVPAASSVVGNGGAGSGSANHVDSGQSTTIVMHLPPPSAEEGNGIDVTSAAAASAVSASASPPAPSSVSAAASKAADSIASAVDLGSVGLASLFLWVGALMLYFSLAFYFTALIYDSWVEMEDGSQSGATVRVLQGKGLTQYALLGVTLGLGVAAALLLSMRLFGALRAQAWFKPASIFLAACMATTGRLAYTTFKRQTTIEDGARLGAGAEYTDNAFTYALISCGTLIMHEVLVRAVQEMRTRRHVQTEAKRTLQLVRDQPEQVQHQVQKAAIEKQVAKALQIKRAEEADAAEIARAQAKARAKRNNLNGSTNGDHVVSIADPAAAATTAEEPVTDLQLVAKPPHSRPTGALNGSSGGAHDAHIHQLVSRLLHDKDRLTSGQLNLLFSLVLLLYIIQAGALAYAKLEGWDLRQAIEFCVVTAATIGYGDIAPKTDGGRGLLFVFFPISFAVLSYTISLLWTQLFTKADEHLKAIWALLTLYVFKPFQAGRREKILKGIVARRHRIHMVRAHVIKRKENRIRSMSEAASVAMVAAGAVSASPSGFNPASPDPSAAGSPLPPMALASVAEEGGAGSNIELAALSTASPEDAAGPGPKSFPVPHASSPISSGYTSPGGESPSPPVAVAAPLSPEQAAAHAAAEAQEAQEVRALDDEEKAIDAEEAAALRAMDGLALSAKDAEAAQANKGNSTNYKLAISVGFVLLLILGGAALFRRYERWTYFEVSVKTISARQLRSRGVSSARCAGTVRGGFLAVAALCTVQGVSHCSSVCICVCSGLPCLPGRVLLFRHSNHHWLR